MKISGGSLLKGVAGGAAATAATTAAVYGENIYSFFVTGSFQIVDEREKIASLKLPEENCKWPDRYSSEPAVCELNEEKLKKINFYESNSTTVSSVEGEKNFILTIERQWQNKIFDKGYRFILKTKEESSNSTINLGSNFSIYLAKDNNFEFKIREEGKNWYLERAWDEKTIKEKIGLDCQFSNVCSLNGGRKINVMRGNGNKVEGISNLSGGKIKLHKNAKDYQQGLKFTIEEEDVALSGGTTIKKFERDETYEIKLNRNKWYLSRKTTAIDAINENLKGLGLPSNCKMTEEGKTEGCGLDKNKLENINFDGKESSSLTATGASGITLKLKRTNNRDDYPHGVKIIFENTEDVTIKKNGNGNFIEWKKKTNPEYKIKGSGSTKTLEKAWTLVNLADKLGMSGCKNDGTNNTCALKKFNLKIGNKRASKINGNYKNIKYEENQSGYNQGFKFTAERKIDLSESGGSGITELEAGSTYEIIEEGENWILSRVTPSSGGR